MSIDRLSRRSRAGFTLIFVIVATAIIAVLFATAATTLASSRDNANATATIAILQNVGVADSNFGAVITHSPHSNHQLTTQITTSDSAVCLTQRFSAGQTS